MSNNQKSLSHLVEHAKKGDEQAFAEIYNRFSKPVYYNALKQLGNDFDARDILQEVMLDLYKNIHTIENPQALPLYLYRASYHRSMNLLKKSQADLPGDDLEPLLDVQIEEAEDFIPQEFLENKERRQQIVRLVDELRPNYKSALILFYYNELSVKEIADVLETSTYSVKIWLQRGRKSLRRKLEAQIQKEGALLAVSTPAMTQVLRENADYLFTPDVSTSVWEGIAGQMGFSAATTAIATGASSATAVTAATAATTTTILSGGKIVAALLVTSGVCAAALFGSGLLPTPNLPIFPGQSSGVDIEESQAISTDETTSLVAGSPSTADNRAEPHTSPGSPAAHTADSLPTDSEDGEGPPPSLPLFEVSQTTLTYRQGSLPDTSTILADAGLQTAYAPGELTIEGLEQLDGAIPNHYAILLQAPDGRQRAIIIIIQP